MATPKKKVAVLGSGFLGIVAMISLKEEDCFDITCYEKTDKPGGTWCYRETSTPGVASIMPTTIINHSKEMGALSKYPPKKECNNFMRHDQLYQYILDIAESADVLKYVQYNSEVSRVERSPDYEETGRWTVTVRNTISGIESTDIFDNVLVCVGHINRPKMPSYPGQDLFKGHILHTHSLKGVQPYSKKSVVVVGMGCSGLDAAVETSSVAKQVYISTRSGAHVINRVGPHGYPYDILLIRRWIMHLFDVFPRRFMSWLFESVYLDSQFDQSLFPVKPDHHVFEKDPILNDHIGSKLLSGSIIQKPDIQCFTEDGVIFSGDKRATKVDVVIMATGYTWGFPFLEKGVIPLENGRIDLYKGMWPPHLPQATLAFIGFLLPFGPGFPIGEIQCRWVTQVLAGNCHLPSEEIMLKDCIDRYETNSKNYTPSEKMSTRVDFVQYTDDIASQFGAKPNFLRMMFTDPSLFLKLVFGPIVSYQYRLQGPHSWDGAREAIMTCNERVLWPLVKNNPVETHENIIVKWIKKFLRLIFF